MRILTCALLFGAVVAVVNAAQTPAQEKGQPGKGDEKKGAAKLEGGYTIVSGEEDGKAIPEERIKGSIVRFTGDKVVGTDKDKKDIFVSTYTLDTSKTPWVISMKSTAPKEASTTGLIKKEGDTITIIYALPGGEAPKEFKTKEKQQLFVLKNMNKGEKGGKDPNKFEKE